MKERKEEEEDAFPDFPLLCRLLYFFSFSLFAELEIRNQEDPESFRTPAVQQRREAQITPKKMMRFVCVYVCFLVFCNFRPRELKQMIKEEIHKKRKKDCSNTCTHHSLSFSCLVTFFPPPKLDDDGFGREREGKKEDDESRDGQARQTTNHLLSMRGA